ncbi:MAG: hypothetical protein NPIRA01_00670 [Nitrospirales bacterium]|nr:MAG: hypothetical protein NPIRA01_00670 [Nitrospirales bacterium]
MDIYQVLKKDHRTAKALFVKLLQTKLEDKEREDILIRLKTILATHHENEENIFYTALEERHGINRRIENALEQREQVAYELEDIDMIRVDDQNWHERISELQSYLQDHIKVEETGIFKEARRVFSAHQAQELAQQYLDAKNT